MGTERIELSRISPHAPQACAYTNSATSPKFCISNISPNFYRQIVFALADPSDDLSYFFVFACLVSAFFSLFAFAVFAGLTAAVFEAVFAGAFVETFDKFVIGGIVTGEVALASVFAAEFASILAFVLVAGVSDEVSGFVLKTEIFPFKAGIESISADNIKSVAATIVVFDKTVAVPREP